MRGHWAIENSLHWVLDVAFREDESRTQAGHAGINLAMVRRVAVSLLKRADAKGSIHTRRLMAAWDDDFLLKASREFQRSKCVYPGPPPPSGRTWRRWSRSTGSGRWAGEGRAPPTTS